MRFALLLSLMALFLALAGAVFAYYPAGYVQPYSYHYVTTGYYPQYSSYPAGWGYTRSYAPWGYGSAGGYNYGWGGRGYGGYRSYPYNPYPAENPRTYDRMARWAAAWNNIRVTPPGGAYAPIRPPY